MSLLPRLLFVLCVEYLIFRNVIGQECKFSWPNGTALTPDIFGTVELEIIRDDAPTGTILLKLSMEDVDSITSVTHHTTSDLQYVEPDYDQPPTALTLSLNDNFKKYEEMERITSFSISISFSCTDSRTQVLEFVQPIMDINNHAPEFEKTPYVYKLPMPYPKGLLLGTIYARDVDMTNTNITFHLDPADPNVAGFSLSWASRDSVDRKLYSALLSTQSVITFFDDFTFVLYATDTPSPGSALLTSSTNVTIQIDHENSVLRFARQLYRADLTHLTFADANGKTITFTEGDIVLSGKVDSQVSYEIQDELTAYGGNFELLRFDDRSTVRLRLKSPTETLLRESAVLLKLTAKKSAATESTIIHLSLPGSDTNVLIEYEETSNDVLAIVLGVLLATVTVVLIVIVVRKKDFFASSKKKIVPNSQLQTKL